MVLRLVGMHGDGVNVGGSGGGRELVVYVLWGVELDDGGGGKVTYGGGGRRVWCLKRIWGWKRCEEK